MPKTEAELWDWVVEYNRHATHDRGLTSSYGYHAILDVDLVAACVELSGQFAPPIRVLDIGCGNGRAVQQLAERVADSSLNPDDFEFWGVGMNRYEKMWIPDNRLIHGGLNSHDFQGMKFHLVFSVFAFHYFWHKLEALEKIHNELLVPGGSAYLHFPGYLVRSGETPEALEQTETNGNLRFQELLGELEADRSICPMQFRTVASYSDDDDRALLAEFGHVRFQKSRQTPICFGRALQAFALFETGFALPQMNESRRTYVASHYYSPILNRPKSWPRTNDFRHRLTPVIEQPAQATSTVRNRPVASKFRRPYRIAAMPVQIDSRSVKLDLAIHEHASDTVVLICPGACEPLKGRVIEYATLAETIVDAGIGAVVRYNDPYDRHCDYAEFLLEKLRRIIEYTQESSLHFCSTSTPKLRIIAYSSSAGAAAALACEYDNIETLLLIAPSFDVPRERVLPNYERFQGDVRVLVGEQDQVVLPQQAFWYYERPANANSRQYVEVPGCGHAFEGPHNKSVLLRAPIWAFEKNRPADFPPALSAPSQAWC